MLQLIHSRSDIMSSRPAKLQLTLWLALCPPECSADVSAPGSMTFYDREIYSRCAALRANTRASAISV